jgi:hypothetical protein
MKMSQSILVFALLEKVTIIQVILGVILENNTRTALHGMAWIAHVQF